MVCGPDITGQLFDVLNDIEETFHTEHTQNQRKELCESVGKFWNPELLNFGWDIEHLFLPLTYWLYDDSLDAGMCGFPHKGKPGTREIETLPGSPCGNSVQVGSECHLAGTVNYAMFGLIARLCNDEFGNFSKSLMTRRIENWVFGLFGRDDPGPPAAWATWAFDAWSDDATEIPDYPPGNRMQCSMRCPVPVNISFTWRWLPYHRGQMSPR